MLSKNFDEAYNGNRAPFQLSTHAPWFNFVSDAHSRPFDCW